MALVALALACLVWAQKPDGGGDDGDSSGGTNDVTQVSGTNDTDGAGLDGMGPLMMMGSMAPDLSPVIDAADIAHGYRLESSTMNGQISYEMPEGVSPAGTWHLTGAYDDVLSVDLDGFVFPLGRELCSSLWAHTWGTARPHVRNLTNELVAVGAPMSAVPGVSRFWAAQTTNDTVLLIWENFTLGRIPVSTGASSLIPDSSSLLSAQLELFRSGDFIARSNDVESVYRRINPDDWDDDGVPNEDDPDPLHYGGNHFGPNQDMSFSSNLCAYCWVDIVVHQANARVTFVGDGSSNLPDPSFIAEAEETYRVNLLIGKTYQVKCQMPFEVVGRSDDDIETWWDGDGSLWINWHVYIWAQGEEDKPLLLFATVSGTSGQHRFTMHVSPTCLGGSFTWTKFCCSVSGGGDSFALSCREGCGCGGCCAEGEYDYEGYSLPAYGGSCSCSYEDDPDDPGPDEPEEETPVGVSVGFSRKVIFFEDEYANTPNQVVPWYSDMTELGCLAYGGENGGSVMISIAGADGLVQYGGQPLPISRTLQPYETFSFTNAYRAVTASSCMNDIVVTANFVENETDWTECSSDRATAVKVELTTQNNVNECLHRHVWGSGERIVCESAPSSAQVAFSARNGGSMKSVLGAAVLACPLQSANSILEVSCGSCTYIPTTSVLEPMRIEARNAQQIPFAIASGMPGGAGFGMDLYIMPDEVSFCQLSFMEEVSVNDTVTGYFTNFLRCGIMGRIAVHWNGIRFKVKTSFFVTMQRWGTS